MSLAIEETRMKLIDILRQTQMTELPEKLKDMQVQITGSLAQAYATALNVAYNKKNPDEGNEVESVALEGNLLNVALFSKLQDRLAEHDVTDKAIIYTISDVDNTDDVYNDLVSDIQNSGTNDEIILLINDDALTAGNVDSAKMTRLQAMESYVTVSGGRVLSNQKGRLFKKG